MTIEKNIIRRHVLIIRSRTSLEMLDATGRNQHFQPQVVLNMPVARNGEMDVIFFHIGRRLADVELAKEYEDRYIKPLDPYTLLQINIEDPQFADDHPNGTIWKDERGRWCHAAFDVAWSNWGEIPHRRVHVLGPDISCGHWWSDRWVFAGVEKKFFPV
ncbi:MAG: hypothetical protein WC752_04170 [Patescibacteria group bacterium]|jgi:hypothetical protein